MTATLIGVNTYRLTGLYRAWYDTERVGHSAGERFAVLDPDQETFELPAEAVDATWWWKAASMNVGGVEEDLSGVGANWLDVVGRGLHIEFQRGRTRQFIAGETLDFGQHVRLEETDGRAYLAVSSDSLKLGLCQSPSLSGWPVSAGEKVYVQVDGLLKDPWGGATPPGAWTWYPGTYLYGTVTPGLLSATDDGCPAVALAITDSEILIFAPRPIARTVLTTAYDEYNSAPTTTSTIYDIINAGLSATIQKQIAGSALDIWVNAYAWYNSGAGNHNYLGMDVDGTRYLTALQIMSQNFPGGSQRHPPMLYLRITGLAAGARVVSPIWRVSAGTGTIEYPRILVMEVV